METLQQQRHRQIDDSGASLAHGQMEGGGWLQQFVPDFSLLAPASSDLTDSSAVTTHGVWTLSGNLSPSELIHRPDPKNPPVVPKVQKTFDTTWLSRTLHWTYHIYRYCLLNKHTYYFLFIIDFFFLVLQSLLKEEFHQWCRCIASNIKWVNKTIFRPRKRAFTH